MSPEKDNSLNPEERRECVTNVYCGEQEHAHKEEVFGRSCNEVVRTCTFDVFMSRVRVVDNKDGYAELQIYPTVNGHVATWPAPTTWGAVHQEHGWRITNLYVTSITVEKGEIGIAQIGGGAIEIDRMGGGNWEEGDCQDIKVMQLQCGQDVNPVYIDITCHRVKEALAGETTCQLQLEFRAYNHMQSNLQTHAS